MNNLILRTTNSPYGDTNKGSVLSQNELDNNFIYLKGQIIYTATTNSNIITLSKMNGEIIDVNISGNSSDFYTTGATLVGSTIYFDRNDILSAYTVNLSAFTQSGTTNLAFEKPYQIISGNNLFAFGDSITVANGYIEMFCQNTSVNLYNYAVGGRGVLKAITSAYEFNPKNTGLSISTWMAGFNDYRRSNNILTNNKCSNALQSFIINSFINIASSVSDTNYVVRSGTWQNLPGGIIGDLSNYIGGNPLYTNIVNSSLSYNFSGQTIVIGTWGVDGTTEKGGVIEVIIDGINYGTWDSNFQTDGVSDGADPNTRIQSTLYFKGLSAGNHTITVNVISITPSGYVYLDYFATLRKPQNTSTVLVYDIPKMDSIGYSTFPSNASDIVFNNGDLTQESIINKFKEYPVIRIKTNNFYNVSTGLGPDHIHPNLTGHSQILEASLQNISQSPIIENQDSILNIVETGITQSASININGSVLGNIFKTGNAFIYSQGTSLSISLNRDPRDGTLINPSLPVSLLVMKTDSNDSNFQFYTSDSAGSFNNVLKINAQGDLEQSIGRWFYLNGGKENINGSVRVGSISNSPVIQKRISNTWVDINIISTIPTNSGDSVGGDRSITWDDNYLYWKANNQWLRISGTTF